MVDRIEKSDEEWREQLSSQQFKVTRKKGTERAFTGDYWDSKDAGSYRCVCCDIVLFSSDDKFDSGSGWPSFFRPITAEHVATRDDRSLFMRRTEVICAACDAHLGHVFEDGPEPTGLRYCINSTSLKLERGQDEQEQS